MSGLSVLLANYPFIKPLVLGLVWASVLTGALYLGGMFVVWLERKFTADMQSRFGPNRVGKYGLLQLIADAFKLLTKEDITPKGADWLLFLGAPVLAVMSALLMAAGMPYGYIHVPDWSIFGLSVGGTYLLAPTNLDVGLLYVEAVSAVSVVGIFMAGWASVNKYALIGAFRSVAKMIGYEVPLAMSVVGVAVMAGSLNFVDVVSMQTSMYDLFPVYDLLKYIPAWFIILQPIGFVVFGTSLIAELGSKPFDQIEAEEEVVAGWGVEYSGMRWALIYFSEYFHLILGSLFMVLLFFGGWTLPFDYPLSLSPLVLLFKVLLVIMAILVVRWSLPRYRIDQVQSLGWKLLIPLSLLNLVWAGALGVMLGGV
ncbi:MAG: F420H2 dehydrogenase subunit FpoH [Methermicoccaceae archaeon]